VLIPLQVLQVIVLGSCEQGGLPKDGGCEDFWNLLEPQAPADPKKGPELLERVVAAAPVLHARQLCLE
jgi:hypothetical protein